MNTLSPNGPGIVSKLKDLLGRLFNLFPLGGTTGGVKILGQVQAGQSINGSPATPTYTFVNDPTTGLYSIGAGSMRFSHAGTAGMEFHVGGIFYANQLVLDYNNGDVSIVRFATGVAKISNGSTGNGTLLMGAAPGSTSAPLTSTYLAALSAMAAA